MNYDIVIFFFVSLFVLRYLRIFIYMKGNKYYFYNRNELFCKIFDIEVKEVKPVTLRFSTPYIIEERLVITL